MRGMARKDGRYHCRGGPDHEILPVIPDPPYANSGVQPSTDNRTGYVVDLAGDIYELVLSVHSSSHSSLFFVIHSLHSHSILLLLNESVEEVRTWREIYISTLETRQNSFSRSVFGRDIRAQLSRPSYLLTAVVEPSRERILDSVSLRLVPGIAYRFKHFSGESRIDATCLG